MRIKPIWKILAAACVVSCSCSKGIEPTADTGFAEEDYSAILIPESQVPLYADITSFDLTGNTRTRSDETTVSLESLLDRTKFKVCEVDGQLFSQIAFKTNDATDVLASTGKPGTLTAKSWTGIRKYLIYNKYEGETRKYIVTMVTGEQYYRLHPDFDFFEKPNYTGVVLYSKLDGTLFHIQRYTGGSIIDSRPMTPKETATTDVSDNVFVYLYVQKARTRTIPPPPPAPGDGGDDDDDGSEFNNGNNGGGGSADTITASICIANGWGWYYNWRSANLWNPEDDPTDFTTNNGTDNNGTGGGGGTGNTGGNEQPDRCTFNLKTNLPDEIEVIGDGPHTRGTYIQIRCQNRYSPQAIGTHSFSGWVGDFAGRKETAFEIKVEKDITSTAYYDVILPCATIKNGVIVTNPLNTMQLAATSKNGNYMSATFHYVRTRQNGKTYKHQGIDFMADIGTETYAAMNGKIVRVKNDADFDRDKDTEGVASDGYGNVITIACPIIINGQEKTLYLQYSHMQYGNVTAWNPRENRPFQKNDPVYAGEIIGYTGNSGNAYNVPNPHIHMGASFSINPDGTIPKDSWIDAMPYLNGTYDSKTVQNDEGMIKNIKCN